MPGEACLSEKEPPSGPAPCERATALGNPAACFGPRALALVATLGRHGSLEGSLPAEPNTPALLEGVQPSGVSPLPGKEFVEGAGVMAGVRRDGSGLGCKDELPGAPGELLGGMPW